MSVVMPANLILYTDIPLLNQYRNIPPPNTNLIIASIERALSNEESICSVYSDVLCGQSNFIIHAITKLGHDLKDVALVYKVQCYGHLISYENVFLDEILTQLGHALHNIGTQHARLDRLIKYFIHLCVQVNKEFIVIIMNDAHNLKSSDYKILAELIVKLKAEGIHLLLLLVGEASILQDTFTPTPFDTYGIIPTSSFHIGGITTKQELMYVLNYYDQACTTVFFPDAYREGLRLVEERSTVLDAFKSVSTVPATKVVGVPLEILIQTIETCLKLYGSMGEQQYWPSQAHWIQSISYTCYPSYTHKI